jgi:hypothetical protein
MTTMVWINVLLAIPFIALWAGIPLWLVLRRPDTRPQPATAALAAATLAAPAVPEPRVHAAYRRAA